MNAVTVVRARIDSNTKEQAAAVLSAMGLTISDALRMTLMSIAKERTIPFKPMRPSAKTVAAIVASRRGEVSKTDIDSVVSALNDAA